MTTTDPTTEMVTLTHSKRGRTRTIEADRAPLLRSQGWVDQATNEPVPYSDRKLKDLQAEIQTRNTDRAEADQIVLEGRPTIATAAAALEADDATQDDDQS